MESLGVVNYFSYLLGVVLVILLPGPNSLYVLSTATRRGKAAAVQAIAGVFVGDLVLMLATAGGGVSLLKAFPALFITLKTLGALFLGFIGYELIRAGYLRYNTPLAVPATANIAAGQSAIFTQRQPFSQALLIALMNPKAIFFLLSYFLQFVDPNAADPTLAFSVLIVTLQTCSLIYLFTLVALGERVSNYFSTQPRVGALFSAGTGFVFLGFAVNLVLQRMA